MTGKGCSHHAFKNSSIKSSLEKGFNLSGKGILTSF